MTPALGILAAAALGASPMLDPQNLPAPRYALYGMWGC
jgi:hypothetical protein